MLRRHVLAAAIGATLLAPGLALAQVKEVSLAVTDVAGLESLQREFGPFRDVIQARTGLKVNFHAVSSRTAAVEAVNARKLDFVLTGPAEYVVFRKRANAEPVVGLSRPDYFSVIVTIAGRGITLPSDLKGKKVTFGDVGSTSQHLGPMQLLADYGLDPRKDIQALHVNRNVAIEALKKGDVAAATMNDTHLKVIRERDPNTPYEVIARTRDLPNDVLLAAAHVDKATVEKLRRVFVDHSKELVDAVVGVKENRKYLGMVFLPTIKDSDYNYVRSMYRTIGYPEYADFVGE
ncbi:MAG: phosphate/phosphite/phosphonate ABC transporter substrate-binding protein [Thalassobaculales bacterium]